MIFTKDMKFAGGEGWITPSFRGQDCWVVVDHFFVHCNDSNDKSIVGNALNGEIHGIALDWEIALEVMNRYTVGGKLEWDEEEHRFGSIKFMDSPCSKNR